MKHTDRELTAALREIGSHFKANELAYLATTSKVEHPFRDRLAYLLHQQYEDSGYMVAREWDRIDLAVVDPDGDPVCFVELKAMYTFDALKNPRRWTDATSADEVKARASAKPETAVYSLLLATHLNTRTEPKFSKVVKYSAGINNALLTHEQQIIRDQAIQSIRLHLNDRNVVAHGQVEGGRAFGLTVTLLYWLIRDQGPDAITPSD